MKYVKYIVCLLLVLNVASCNYFSFTPRSKKNKSKEKPSILIFDRMVDFRKEQMSWPVSKADFISKGMKYYEVFNDFPYQQTSFKVIDSNNMVFSFSQHIKDVKHDQKTGKTELNDYSGRVIFYKLNDKFIWKLKMN